MPTPIAAQATLLAIATQYRRPRCTNFVGDPTVPRERPTSKERVLQPTKFALVIISSRETLDVKISDNLLSLVHGGHRK
jgi:hypothetical protein